MKTALKGTMVAVAVAGLFGCLGKKDAKTAADPAAGTTTSDLVHCAGVNECKGQGKCGAADGSHSCAGKNECKGKGWIEVSAADCTAKGGSVAQ